MKKLCRDLLNRTGLYRWLRYSPIYDSVAWLWRSPYAELIANDRIFFKQLFNGHRVRMVFDVGANEGDKANVFKESADRVVCVEADPAMAATLQFRFGRRKSIVIENVAVGGSAGRARMFRKKVSAFNTLSEKWSESAGQIGVSDKDVIDVPVTTLDLLIAAYGVPDYIKIDVEGYELPVIEGLNHPVQILSFEANVPAFMPETRSIVAKLLAQQPDLLFNFRNTDRPTFSLSRAVPSEALFAKLTELGNATCDIFAFSSAPPCES